MNVHVSKRFALIAAAIAAIGCAGVALAVPAGAGTNSASVPEPANLGQLKNEIRAYYGDTGTNQPSPDSSYAHDVAAVEGQVRTYVTSHRAPGYRAAMVVDIDDTTLNSYPFGATSDFAFGNQTALLGCITTECQVPVFGMPDLLTAEAKAGVAIFYVTARPDPLQAITQKALADAGVPAGSGLFLKPTTTAPAYLDCGLTCTTVQYKSETRAHIESLGYTNLGDQQSDLDGGHAQQGFKFPNPMYFTP